MPVLRCPDDMRLEDYFYGDLAPVEKTLLRLHVNTCPRCKAKLEALRRFEELLRLYPAEEPPAGFEEDLLRMVRSWDFEPRPDAGRGRGAFEGGWLRGYKIRWAVASLVMAIVSLLEWRFASRPPAFFGSTSSFLASLYDLGALWDWVASGAWWDSLVSVVSAVKTDGIASLGILRYALPSQMVSVLVFAGISTVVLFRRRRSSNDRGEGTR
ncbi:MAG TPA: hypothetical protein GX500_08640 [Firmicutes bacterium]|nr:hypothetical protein [Candidatus Fermentithermobacillaceae bacterium]